MKFGALLNSLAGKAGIKTDDDTLKKLLGFVEVSQFDVPDEFSQALERNLLTSESAAANPDVRSKIMAEALNGVDSRIESALGDFEFDDAFKGDIKQTKNSYEKLTKLTKGLQQQLTAAKEKAKQTKDPQDKKEVEVLQAQVADVNKQIDNLKRSHEIEIDNLKRANLEDKRQFTLKSILAGKPLPKMGELPLDTIILTAQNLISQEIAKNNLVVNFDEAGNPVLRQRVDGAEVKYFKDNKEIDYSSFIDGVLAQNKFVQVNDPKPPTPASGNNPPQPPNGNPTNLAAVAEIERQMQELGATI